MANEQPQQNQISVAQRGTNIAKYHQQALTSLLPTGIDPPKFLRQMATAFEKIPKLLDCSEQSIKLAFLNIAGLGLDPSGMTGEAYVLPFKGVATPLISFRGYIALASRSGAIKAMDTGVVFENDYFEFEQGSHPYVKHRRAFGDRGNVMCYFANATLPSGHNLVEIMDVGEIDRIAKLSPSGKSGPWGSHFDEMARKTVLRRLSKRIPWNGDIAAKMTEAHLAEDSAFYEVETVKPARQVDRMKAAMLGQEPATNAPQQPPSQNEPSAQTDAPQVKSDTPAVKPTCPNPKCGKPVDAEMLAECVERGNCPACAPKSAGLNL